MKLFGFLLATVCALCLVLAGGAWWVFFHGNGGGESQVFVVKRGDNYISLAKELQSRGIIRDERAFRWYANYFLSKRHLRRGEYQLQTGSSVVAVMRILNAGKTIAHNFTIPEGYNIYQIAQKLEAEKFGKTNLFLKAVRQKDLLQKAAAGLGVKELPPSLEGFLFPDTYDIETGMSEEEIVELMLERFLEESSSWAKKVSGNVVAEEFKLSPYQVLILASIVEKETGASSERPQIASVFLNRMRKRMRLQTDPTVIYGVYHTRGYFDGNIRRSDLHTPTPYNTYTNDGLPLGPIANPGLNAIRAVLQPAQTDYLFFVSYNDGTHFFSRTFSEHSEAVKRLQLAPGSKEGKSWRDLPSDKRAVKH
jgi:UPF0755 protein